MRAFFCAQAYLGARPRILNHDKEMIALPTLIVLFSEVSSPAQASSLIRDARFLLPGKSEDGEISLLLFCDLPASHAAREPADGAIIRTLQSGAMSLNARARSRVMLLVRQRTYSDAERAYLGAAQPLAPMQAVAQMITSGETDARFECATAQPASLKGFAGPVLFMPASLSCTPDTPVRMARRLGDLNVPFLAARVLAFPMDPPSALVRLAREGFSLSPLREASAHALVPQGFAKRQETSVLMAAAHALPMLLGDAPEARLCPVAQDCFFAARQIPTLRTLFDESRRFCARALRAARSGGWKQTAQAMLPLAQLALLFLCAALGSGWLTGIVLLAPEFYALAHPRLLPGALIRLALLPNRAMAALSTLMGFAFARTKRFRLELSPAALGAGGSVFFGSLLLSGALFSVRALVPLFFVSLLWLSAPVLLPSLELPPRERIPLDDSEQREMRALAESAFFSLEDPSRADSVAPAPEMLCACAGCMLGLLEADEAARRASSLCDVLESAPRRLSAQDTACMLASAQFFRERMAECDAALRPLPARIESLARALPRQEESGLLAALLYIASHGDASPESLQALHGQSFASPLDALFLPLSFALRDAQSDVLLPLTHPHTFLQGALPDAASAPVQSLPRFLILAAAVLRMPFEGLLWRSPVLGPYKPLLSILALGPRLKEIE